MSSPPVPPSMPPFPPSTHISARPMMQGAYPFPRPGLSPNPAQGRPSISPQPLIPPSPQQHDQSIRPMSMERPPMPQNMPPVMSPDIPPGMSRQIPPYMQNPRPISPSPYHPQYPLHGRAAPPLFPSGMGRVENVPPAPNFRKDLHEPSIPINPPMYKEKRGNDTPNIATSEPTTDQGKNDAKVPRVKLRKK